MARVATTLLIFALFVAANGAAAEPYCQQNPVLYCNDFETGFWEGMEHEDDSWIITSGVPGLHSFEGDGSIESVLDTDGIGASFGYRFQGVEQVYVRFYMRWDSNWDRPMHHFFAIHGDQSDDRWSCHGTAGCRPNGLKCLNGATVDTREQVTDELPGEPFFYSYFPDMSCDPGNSCDNYADPAAICQGCTDRGLPCASGLECCWGNHFNLNQGIPVSMEQDRWYAIETMVKANSVFLDEGNADGEMALWVDGVLVAHHTGMLWRHTNELLLNHFVMWNYFPEATQTYRIWFDNLIIATTPIGVFNTDIFRDDFEAGNSSAWSSASP